MSRMISYALNQEDVVLNRVFKGHTNGFYVDIGAAHPNVHSTTRFFSQLGWRGVNVEPNPTFYNELIVARPLDINLNIAISEHSGEMTYFEDTSSRGESTLSVDQAAVMKAQGRELVAHKIRVSTLASICDEYVGNQTIDFLSVDVEGHERAVLSSADFTRWRPRIIVIEATQPGTNILIHQSWEHLLTSSNYLFTLFDGINRFYVREEDRDWVGQLSAPANFVDDAISHREAELAREAEHATTLLAEITMPMKYGRLARATSSGVQRLVNTARRVTGLTPTSARPPATLSE